MLLGKTYVFLEGEGLTRICGSGDRCMNRALERKGGSVADAMIVNWTSKAREKQIEEGTDRLATSEELWIHSRRTVRK